MLEARVQELERRLGRSSEASHLPPWSDGPSVPQRPARASSGRSRGGQAGHEGHTRMIFAEPDEVVLVGPDRCRVCGAPLSDGDDAVVERHQESEIPTPSERRFVFWLLSPTPATTGPSGTSSCRSTSLTAPSSTSARPGYRAATTEPSSTPPSGPRAARRSYLACRASSSRGARTTHGSTSSAARFPGMARFASRAGLLTPTDHEPERWLTTGWPDGAALTALDASSVTANTLRG